MLDYVETQINIPLKTDTVQRVNVPKKKKIIKGVRKLVKDKQ